MDIGLEIAVWSILGLLIALALGMALPAFFRAIRGSGADIAAGLVDDPRHRSPS